MSTESTPLSTLEAFLSEEEFLTELHPPNEDYPYERLIIGLGEDEDERQYIAGVYFVTDLGVAAGFDAEDEDAVFLQIFMELPIQVDSKHEGPLAHWLLMLNGVLPAGAFNIARSTDESSVYYVYNWALPDHNIDPVVFTELVSIMAFFSQEYASITEAIALGKATLQEAQEALAQKGLYSPGMLDTPEA